MTRKRFVKLVMSCGHDRNYAITRAAECILRYGSYQKAWKGSYDLRFTHTFQMLANAIMPAFKRLWQQCKGILKSIGPIITPLGSVGLDWGESNDRSYAGGSSEVATADLPGRKECGNPEEQAKHSGAIFS